MNEKGHPVIDLCCATCRRSEPSSVFQFQVYCKKKKTSIGTFSWCENWNPAKDSVRATVYRFKFNNLEKNHD